MTIPFFCTCWRIRIVGSLYRDCKTKGRNTIRMLVKVSATVKSDMFMGLKIC
jgi:hypothetical protein